MISLLDIGISNLGSLSNALKKIGAEFDISCDPQNINNAQGIIIPGVGSFSDGIKSLERLDLINVIKKKSAKGTPILGICLGMQLLANTSQEFGKHNGLGLVPGDVVKLNSSNLSKVPNIGWHDIYLDKTNLLFNGINSDDSFYFVHSYVIKFNYEVDCIGKILHGKEFVIGFFQHKNIFGAQFHPEKSQDSGLKFLSNFAHHCKMFAREN